MVLLLGLWEVGRFTELQQVVYNSTREGCRDASMGQTTLSGMTSNILLYLQGAEPTAFGSATDSTSLIAPVITLPANTYGYTVWDNTLNRELFTVAFKDTTSPVTDPTLMSQLDVYNVQVSYPVAAVSWYPITQLWGSSRMTASLNWACMVDSPYTLIPSLPAQ
jgi:hypothetical protein